MTYDPIDTGPNDNNADKAVSLDEIDTKTPVDPQANSELAKKAGHPTVVVPSLEAYPAITETTKIVRYQDGSGTVYAAEGSVIHKSTDLGETWSNQGDVGVNVSGLLKLEQTGTLIAISNSDSSIHRSTDDGANWTETYSTLTDRVLNQGFTETPSGHIVVGQYASPAVDGTDIIRSTDDGANWSVVKADATDEQHVQSVRYDRHDSSNRLVAIFDVDPSNGGPRVYESSDEGANWTAIGQAASAGEPNYVTPMFFTDYIAWAMDSPDDANGRGRIYRIGRDDFYAGNWSNSEIVGYVGEKTGFYNVEAADGLYIQGFFPEKTSAEMGFSNELWAVWNNGASVTPLARYQNFDNTLNSRAASQIEFPLSPFDSPLSNDVYVNIAKSSSGNRNSVPTSVVDRGATMPSWANTGVDGFVAPQAEAYRGTASDGTIKNLLRRVSSRTRVENEDGSVQVDLVDNGRLLLAAPGWVRSSDEIRIELDGSSGTPALMIGTGGAGFFVNGSGEIVAVDEAGNTTTIS